MWISKNGDTPIAGWIVYFMENPISMITRGNPMPENQHISVMFHKNRIQMDPGGDDPFLARSQADCPVPVPHLSRSPSIGPAVNP